jgi:hypothetical protein
VGPGNWLWLGLRFMDTGLLGWKCGSQCKKNDYIWGELHLPFRKRREKSCVWIGKWPAWPGHAISLSALCLTSPATLLWSDCFLLHSQSTRDTWECSCYMTFSTNTHAAKVHWCKSVSNCGYLRLSWRNSLRKAPAFPVSRPGYGKHW